MEGIRYGIALWSQTTNWQDYLAAAQLVDRLGYDLLLTNDHLLSEVGPDDQVKFEAWTTLAAWASVTSHAMLGHWVLGNSLRNPAIVAKMATTVDHASNGRVFLGIGAGWFLREHAAFGIDAGRGINERLDWFAEALSFVRPLLRGETVTHAGPRYRVENLRMIPAPVRGTMPIMIGASGEKKSLRLVAQYADWWDIAITPDPAVARHKIAVLEEHCAAVGRDPREIDRLISPQIVIRDDPAEARRVWEAARRRNGADPASDAEARPWLGPPELIAEHMRPLVELGIRGFIAHFPAPFDRETIERWIGEVKPLLAG